MLRDGQAELAPTWRAEIATPLAKVRRHWPLLAVLALFAASAIVVPTMASVATTDDWGYTRSVEILYHEQRLEIFPVVAATAVSQVAWGTIFYALFGTGFGAVRLSTVVITALGGWALYGLCRELGVDRGRSALGAAVYLFNPLTFVLAFTFMTDPHFTAMLIASTLCYVRGLRGNDRAERWTLAGSAMAALAFLARQQGALIPVAVALYLLITGRLRPNRAGLALLLRVGAIPAAATAAYALWLRYVNDVPAVQESFLREARAAGWSGTWELVHRLTFIEASYLGFFALPLTAAALLGLRRLVRFDAPAGWLLFSAWPATLVAGLVAFWPDGRRMPYVAQFMGAAGPGAPDVLGTRPRLLEPGVLDWLTGVCTASALMLGLILCRRVRTAATPHGAAAGLVLAIGLWQAVGVLPPSYHYRTWAISLDRYLLPLLPFAICLGLWAVRDVRLAQPLAWLVVAAYAAYGIAGTRDYLVYMDAVWDLAREANAAGVANTQLDAGSAWDGYHLYEYGLDNGIRARTPNGPWWVYFYAPATDSSYVVSGRPLRGYDVVLERSYSTWLPRRDVPLYLLRREGLPWPP